MFFKLKFSFYNYQIRIHYSLTFGFLFFVFIFVFHYNWTFFSAVFFTLFLYFSIFLHELGHYWAARKVSYPVSHMVLHLLGATLFVLEDETDPRKEGFVALSGPVVSILLSFLFINLYYLFGYYLLNYLAVANFVVFFVNMLPVYPLDGGRLIRAVLLFFLSSQRVNYLVRIPTIVALFILGFFALKELFWDKDFFSFLKYYVIAFFLFMLAFSKGSGTYSA